MPVPRKGTAQAGDQIKDSHHTQAVATTEAFTGEPCQHCAQNRSEQGAEYGYPQQEWRQLVSLGERAGSAGDDRSVESKQEAAQSRYDCALRQISIQLHADSSRSDFSAELYVTRYKPPTSYHRVTINSLDGTLPAGGIWMWRRNGSFEQTGYKDSDS